MLPEIVAEAADRYGERAAYVSADDWALSYADLHALSDEAAAGLARRGVGEGDVVALLLPSTPDYVVAYLGAAKVGAVTAGINPKLTAREREGAWRVASPRLTLTTAALALPVETGTTLLVEPATREPGEILAPLRIIGGRPEPLTASADRPVAIVFTSGTTGDPKGATFTNRQLTAIERFDTGGNAAWGTGTTNLAATQFAHVGTMTKLPWQLRSGATTHLLHRWRPADALRLIAELRLPIVAGVSPQIAMLLRVPEFDRYDFSAVQGIVVGGGPVTPALADEATTRFGAPMSIRYSSTESGGVGTGTAFDAPREEMLFTVGRPRGEVELAIRDEHGADVAAGEVGEVCFRSAAATTGYWGNPEATTALFHPDRFLRMGDLGFIDDAGCLRLAGRTKEMFVRGGYNVYPMEVEAVLATHPAVQAIAVIPRPDPVMGEIGVAVVVPAGPPPDLDDLRRFGAAQLAGYKLPEALEVIPELPLTAMEKLDRRALVERFGG